MSTESPQASANEGLRAEHDAVLRSLETRDSTHHFAHAAVAFFLSISFLGSSAKLWWDYWAEEPHWAIIAAALGLASLSYSLGRGLLGSRAYGAERVKVTRLLDLRRTIGLDAPLQLPIANS